MEKNVVFVKRCVRIVTITLLVSLAIRVSIVMYYNFSLSNGFVLDLDSSEEYQQISERKADIIDYYINKFYRNRVYVPLGIPPLNLKQPIRYYPIPDNTLGPVVTLEAGMKYEYDTLSSNRYKYGVLSWPTNQRGWRLVIPFVLLGNENLIGSTPLYFVQLKDLHGVLRAYLHERGGYWTHRIPMSKHRQILLEHDKMLYEQGIYLSPDLYKPILDRWNIILLVIVVCFAVSGFSLKRRSSVKGQEQNQDGTLLIR